MAEAKEQSNYQRLVQNQSVAKNTKRAPDPMAELDAVVRRIETAAQQAAAEPAPAAPSPVDELRSRIDQEFVPIAEELVQKYASLNLDIRIDSADFVAGGRELRIIFEVSDRKLTLVGTVTSDAIAFQEMYYTNNRPAQIASGPMLRIRRLGVEAFRGFLCEQLVRLLRTIAPR